MIDGSFLSPTISTDFSTEFGCFSPENPEGGSYDPTIEEGNQLTVDFLESETDTTWFEVGPLMTSDTVMVWSGRYGTQMSTRYDDIHEGGHINPFNGTPLDMERVAQIKYLQSNQVYSQWGPLKWSGNFETRHDNSWGVDTLENIVSGAHLYVRFGVADPSHDDLTISFGLNRFWQYRASRTSQPPVFVDNYPSINVSSEEAPAPLHWGDPYPNPAVSSVTIPGFLAGRDVLEVFDLLGRKVKDGTGGEIDLTDVSPGTYLVRLQRGTTIETRRIMVAR